MIDINWTLEEAYAVRCKLAGGGCADCPLGKADRCSKEWGFHEDNAYSKLLEYIRELEEIEKLRNELEEEDEEEIDELLSDLQSSIEEE